MNNYFRLILTSDNQTFASPVYNNLNFPDLSPYKFCKVFIESIGLTVAETTGATEHAHDFISVEVADYTSGNTQICNGSNTSNSSIIDIISGELEVHQGSHNVVKCNKNKTADILNDGAVFPINILQNNSIKLNLRYANGSDIVAPPAPHTDYKIILGIQLIKEE